jgi:D-alanine-D-alanine ligase
VNVALLHEDPAGCREGDAADVIVQRDAVAAWLTAAGHHVSPIACSLDLSRARAELLEPRCDVVFNLVEALGGTDRLMPLAALLVEALGLPMTGFPAAAIEATTNKVAAKATLTTAHVPVPPRLDVTPEDGLAFPCRGIVKAIWEHASFGMSDTAVVELESAAAARDQVHRAHLRTGVPHLCEAFIEGREFNLSMLEGSDGLPRVLAPAEITFDDLPAGQPTIVGHRAKWDPASVEWKATPRRFDFPPADDALLRQLTALAERCWHVVGARGYARVDFRVDPTGHPFVLEVNANPCLSPDAGFMAAAARSDIAPPRVVARLVDAALRGVDPPTTSPPPISSEAPRVPHPPHPR